VDLYLGERLPLKVETEVFWQKLKSLLAEGGLLVFNLVRESWVLEKGLRGLFSHVETETITAPSGGKNHLYLAW
jgi:spermidine synthase